MSKMEISNITKNKLKEMFSEGKRFDGRGILDHRDLSITYNVSNMAEGSARVKLGKTEVIAGVKLQVGTPYPDSPNSGNLMVSGDLLPLASPKFESGPPKFNAIELPRLVDRAIRGADMIDLSKLVVTEGEKVWTVIIDIYPINDDGALIDAATLAALAALKDTKMPSLDEEGKINYKKRTDTPLPLTDTMPISVTFYKLGDIIYLDPTREEEEACETRITFGISKWNGRYMLNSCQKKLKQEFSTPEILKMMEIIPKKFEELDTKLKSYLK